MPRIAPNASPASIAEAQAYLSVTLAASPVVFLAMTAVATWLVARRRGVSFVAWHAAVLSQQALWNPVFHAGTTVAYREYSPGLVTAVALFPPTWVALTAAAVREGRISHRAVTVSAFLGGAVHAAAVARQVYGVGADTTTP